MRKNGWFIKCPVCKKERYITPGLVKQGRGKYCSRVCASKDHPPEACWKANKNNPIFAEKIRKSVLERFKDESKHPRWKGDQVGYYGVHDWITKHYGQPKKCQVCGLDDEKRKYHWANLDYKYARNIESWKRMCVSCHRKYDYVRNP